MKALLLKANLDPLAKSRRLVFDIFKLSIPKPDLV